MHNSGFNNYAKNFINFKKKQMLSYRRRLSCSWCKNSNSKNDYVGNCSILI